MNTLKNINENTDCEDDQILIYNGDGYDDDNNNDDHALMMTMMMQRSWWW